VSFPLEASALSEIEQRLAAGEPLDLAIGSHLRTRHDPSGALVIDDSGEADRDGVAAALRFLAQVSRESTRSVAVLSQFDSSEADALEEHDYIGRLIVRLNISKLVAVGNGARHIQSAAGLEGSWDGESVIVETLPEAYDLLRDQLHENDVVLVKASTRAGLGQFTDRAAGYPQ
jgi:UDP-N-acetylmuramoyl-tripeptide--D-alanyl-D-alanine ligase